MPKDLIQSVSREELQAGDIILYRPPVRNVPIGIKLISYVQALIDQKGGHYDTTHAAIVTRTGMLQMEKEGEKDKDGNPKTELVDYVQITHLQTNGLNRDYITNKDEDTLNPNFFIFRAADKQIANNIAAKATEIYEKDKDETNPKNKIAWKISAAVKAFVNAFRSPQEKKDQELSLSSLCSQFVIESIKQATKGNENYYPDIPSRSLPKLLEANLYKNDNFKLLSYTGKNNAHTIINNLIIDQIIRLKQGSPEDKAKAVRIEIAHKQLTSDFGYQSKPPMEKAMLLVKEIGPELKFNTGRNFRESVGYKTLKKVANRLGIYKKDLDKVSINSPVMPDKAVSNKIEEEIKKDEGPRISSHRPGSSR